MKVYSLILRALPGLLVAFLISGISFNISKQFAKAWFGPTLDMFIMCVIFGLVIGLIFSKWTEKSVMFAASSSLSKDILVPIGLILYGTQINWKDWSKLNIKIFIGILVVMLVYFLIIWFLNKRFGINEKLTWLTCVGSSICGASAIAITAPFVEAKDEDTSSAMITILIIGLISVFGLYFLNQSVFQLSSEQYAIQGAMIHNQTGLVKMGAQLTKWAQPDLPKEAVKKLTDEAVATKSIRTSLIVPLVFLVIFLSDLLRKKRGEAAGIRLRSINSLLILGLLFFGASILFTFYPGLGKEASKAVEPWFKIIFGAALASIGFAVNAKAFAKTKLPQNIVSAFIAWVAVVIVSYLFVI